MMKERRNLRNSWLMFHPYTKVKIQEKMYQLNAIILASTCTIVNWHLRKSNVFYRRISLIVLKKVLMLWTKSRLWNTVCLRRFFKSSGQYVKKQHFQKSTKIEFGESLLEERKRNTLGLFKNNWFRQWGNSRVTATAFGCCYFAIFLTTYKMSFWF